MCLQEYQKYIARDKYFIFLIVIFEWTCKKYHFQGASNFSFDFLLRAPIDFAGNIATAHESR